MNKTILAFDTNIWIYLTKLNYQPLLDRLIEEVSKEDLIILVNDVILLEWNRNKSTLIKSLTDSIKHEYQSAKQISHYIENRIDKEHYVNILKKYSGLDERINSAESRVAKVEQLLTTCTCVNTTDQQKLYVANLAINKIPPFKKSKNNFNDALIILSLTEYVNALVKQNGSTLPYKYDFVFISNNPNDFKDPETNEIFSTLLIDCDNLRIITVTDLAFGLSEKERLIDDFDDWLEDMLDTQIEYEAEIARGK